MYEKNVNLSNKTRKKLQHKMMKRTILWAAAALAASCTPNLKVEVTNPSQTERERETVEIAWSEIAALSGATPENVVVFDSENEEIPSQVVYAGSEEPQALIFQVDAEAGATERFVVKTGVRSEYPTRAYGRYVPERLDDYAWENDRIAFRAYGPALETAPGEMLATPGFDTWVKSTEEPVIDVRYKRGHYHKNHGDGMDCYKVGKTLGAGASAPLVDGQLWLSRNYVTQQTLDNGPIRTAVRFTYAPFDANGTQVSLTKTITLDAGTHLNRIDNVYEGEFEQLPVAAGFIRHDVKQLASGEDWLGMREAASDSKNPERDGDIYLGVVLPGAQILPDSAGHALAVKNVKPGEQLTYYAGAGWSQGYVEDLDDWCEELQRVRATAEEPLQVVISK